MGKGFIDRYFVVCLDFPYVYCLLNCLWPKEEGAAFIWPSILVSNFPVLLFQLVTIFAVLHLVIEGHSESLEHGQSAFTLTVATNDNPSKLTDKRIKFMACFKIISGRGATPPPSSGKWPVRAGRVVIYGHRSKISSLCSLNNQM